MHRSMPAGLNCGLDISNPAIEIGDENHRGSYGASPGDDAIPEPYLYVSVWWPGTGSAIRRCRPTMERTIVHWCRFENLPTSTTATPVDVAGNFFGSIRDLIAR